MKAAAYPDRLFHLRRFFFVLDGGFDRAAWFMCVVASSLLFHRFSGHHVGRPGTAEDIVAPILCMTAGST